MVGAVGIIRPGPVGDDGCNLGGEGAGSLGPVAESANLPELSDSSGGIMDIVIKITKDSLTLECPCGQENIFNRKEAILMGKIRCIACKKFLDLYNLKVGWHEA